MSKKKIFTLLILILIIFLFSLRMVHLSADPPETLSASAGPYGDPGGYAYNARNKVVFGQWELDKLNPMYISLIPHSFTYLSFILFGVGIAQMNLVPIFFSCLILVLLIFVVKKMFSSSMGLIALYLLGISYLFIMYSRIANRIMPMIFFLILSLFFFQKGLKKKEWFFLAGLSCLLALISKGVCFYILAAFFLGFIVYLALNMNLKEAILPLSYFIFGFSIACAIWIIFVYVPYGYMFKSIADINIQFLIPPKSIPKMLEYFWTRPSILFDNMPIISLLSCFSFLILVYRLIHKPKAITLLECVMILWFAAGFVYFSIIYQRVTRHFIPQILPMVFLSTSLIHNFLQSSRITKPKKFRLLFGFAFFFWLLFPASKLLKQILEKLPESLSNIWIATCLLAIMTLFLTLLFFLIMKLWPTRFEIPLSPSLKKVIVLGILLSVLFFNGQKYLSWALHPQFKLKQISTDLGEAFDQAAIAGLWAPVICLENKHRAHESYPGYINDEKDFLEKFKITHVFATTFFGGLENNYYWRNFPEAMARARLLAKYHVWNGLVLLYDLYPSLKHFNEKNHYEAEIFTLPKTMPRYDSDSTGTFAAFGEKDKARFIVVASSTEKVPSGKHIVTFSIKKEKSDLNQDVRIARIDVISKEVNRPLAIKNIFGSNFIKDKKYQEFSLPVFLKKSRKLDFRVYTDGVVSLWVDNIRITKNSE
jgi:4-amino-4-deoxy-L-arabinose transferase-like glycosyltransferase